MCARGRAHEQNPLTLYSPCKTDTRCFIVCTDLKIKLSMAKANCDNKDWYFIIIQLHSL